MSVRFRPARPWRAECLPLALSLLLPAGLAAVFPAAALKKLPPAAEATAPCVCAFVSLTAERERQAVALSRASWLLGQSADRQWRIEMLPPFLSEVNRSRPVAELLPPSPGERSAVESYKPDLPPPTLAAPPPVRLPADNPGAPVRPTFSKESMLRLPW